MVTALVAGACILVGCASQGPAPAPSRTAGDAQSGLPSFPHMRHPNVRQQRVPDAIWPRLREGFALPELDHPAVTRELDWYTDHPLYLEAMWARAERYLHFILGEVERRGMPTELALLPVIESGFRPQAVSPSAAAGLWQVVPATGTYLGLERNQWVDQRMDVVRSTRAALDYLQTLHGSFGGDWLLALAAYNGGPGYVGRLQNANRKRGRGTGVQDLPLRQESATYVWRMLALRRLLLAPHRYGVSLPPIADAPYFMAIDLPHQVDLDALAALDDLSTEEVVALNPGLRRGVTPPAGPHRVLVPARIAQAVHARFATGISPVSPWAEDTLAHAGGAPARPAATYSVRRGDTLSTLARRHGTTVAALRQANNLGGDTLRVGQRLRLPDKGTAPAAGSGGLGCTPGYTVAPGDTLWSVARARRVSVSALRACNIAVSSADLRPGQRLNLPRTALAGGRTVAYEVRRGDTLTRISAALGVTLRELLSWNQTLSPTRPLRAGDRIHLTLFN